MMKYSERVSGSHWSSTGCVTGIGRGVGFCGGRGVAGREISGVGTTVAVAGVFGAGVFTAVVAGVF